MVNFRDLATSAKKFKDNGSAASDTFVKNTVAAANTWQQNTEGSEDNYNKGVQLAISKGRFKRGVTTAGAAKFSKQVNAVGGARFSDGITKAAGTWQSAFGDVAAKVAATTLPARGLRGSQANYDRSKAMGQAFAAAAGRGADA